MRPFDQLQRDARDGSPFSNGTSWDIWADRWCYECSHDSEEMVNRGEGCPLILLALTHKTPAEWLPTEHTQDYVCVEFDRRDEGGGEDEPDTPAPSTPERPIPGQIEMFGRDEFERPRMLVDVVNEVRQVLTNAQKSMIPGLSGGLGTWRGDRIEATNNASRPNEVAPSGRPADHSVRSDL